MSASWAKPGVKCVFVGGWTDSLKSWPMMTGAPVKGATYTIRDMKIGEKTPCLGKPVIRLGETVVKPHNAEWEDSWLALSGFRPLVTRTEQQDVALFRDLLVGLPAGVDA